MMTLNKNFLSTVGFALTIAFATHSISAHETLSIGGVKYRWSGNSCSFRVDAAMSPGFRSAFQGAINSWNATPANFSFSMTTAPLWRPFTGNLSNEVWLTTNDDLLDGAAAVCITNLGTHIVEADIAFDARLIWTSGTSKSVMQAYGGPAMPSRGLTFMLLSLWATNENAKRCPCSIAKSRCRSCRSFVMSFSSRACRRACSSRRHVLRRTVNASATSTSAPHVIPMMTDGVRQLLPEYPKLHVHAPVPNTPSSHTPCP